MDVAKPVKHWFDLGGHGPYERTLKDQLKGLDWAFANCRGKTVLDVGCAEGFISLAMLQTAGALAVHGVELMPARVDMADRSRGKHAATFEVGDMNVWRPRRMYDMVLALAILHKLRDPTEVCASLANAARHSMIIRLPPEKAPHIEDRRSNFEKHDIEHVMQACGFNRLSAARSGHLGEWVGVYVRST